MYLQSIKSVKHNAANSVNRSILKKSRHTYRVWCLYSSFVHGKDPAPVGQLITNPPDQIHNTAQLRKIFFKCTLSCWLLPIPCVFLNYVSFMLSDRANLSFWCLAECFWRPLSQRGIALFMHWVKMWKEIQCTPVPTNKSFQFLGWSLRPKPS